MLDIDLERQITITMPIRHFMNVLAHAFGESHEKSMKFGVYEDFDLDIPKTDDSGLFTIAGLIREAIKDAYEGDGKL